MIDTRDLAEKREELQTDLVDSFNDYFDTEIEDFDELIKYIDDSDNEDVQEWKEDNSDDFDHIEEIDYIEYNVSGFSFGATLIEDNEFEDYFKDLVNDCYDSGNVPGFIKYDINWEGVVSDLSVDYSEIKYQGKTYLYRD